MPVNDAYARLTPYELSLPDLAWARERFGAVREEARTRGADAGDPSLFVLLATVGRMLEELRTPDEDPERIHEHGLLLYHAFHFWEAGERLWLLDAPLVRELVRRPPPRPWEGELPAAAGYVQLPQHLVWTEAGEGGVPESVDGFFWAAPDGRDELSVLLATGIRGDRAGLSVVALLPAPLADAGRWAVEDVLGEGRDFESDLPGAALEGLYQVRTSGEVLKLAARTLQRLGERPGEAREPPPGGTPRPTLLPYRKAGPT